MDFLSFLFIFIGLGSLEVTLNRGQRFDWFSSNFIKIFALAAVAGVALFIWRSLTAERPLVNLRLFRNRSFASATLLMFLVGFGLFGSFTMLPLFAQTMLRYTATWAGLVISPGGIASLVAMAMVGALIGKVDTRILVLIGAALNIAAIWLLQSVDLHVSFTYLMFSRLLQGFGLGFLFVPISTAAFSHLPPEQIGNATGLFNLFRNEGGSVGIAMSATVLARHAQVHQANLADHINAFNPIVQQRLAGAANGLFPTAGLDPVTTKELSLRLLYGQMQQQAVVMSYVDVFWMLTVAFVLIIPFVFMLSGDTGKGPVGAH